MDDGVFDADLKRKDDLAQRREIKREICVYTYI